jgi:hypothetical protein
MAAQNSAFGRGGGDWHGGKIAGQLSGYRTVRSGWVVTICNETAVPGRHTGARMPLSRPSRSVTASKTSSS